MKANREEGVSGEKNAPVLSKLILTAAPFVLMYLIFVLIRWLSR
ncbi:MAG: hypothetical protein ACR2QM_06230 [Longimicrobiales bacterium]